MLNDRFKFFAEVDIVEKGKNVLPKDDPDRYNNMEFSGVAADSTWDAEGESLDPKGFVYDRFLKSGLLNLDHLPSRSPVNKSRFWLGEPISATVKDGKFFVKGKLWKNSPEARAFWDKAIEMKESGSTRKPGMSVEGKALERDPKDPRKVTKALITNVALTMTPVNPSTFLDISKSCQGPLDMSNPKDLQTAMIICEFEENGNLYQINKSFKMTVKSKFDKDDFWKIYKSFQRGTISKSILDDYVKKIQK